MLWKVVPTQLALVFADEVLHKGQGGDALTDRDLGRGRVLALALGVAATHCNIRAGSSTMGIIFRYFANRGMV